MDGVRKEDGLEASDEDDEEEEEEEEEDEEMDLAPGTPAFFGTSCRS